MPKSFKLLVRLIPLKKENNLKNWLSYLYQLPRCARAGFKIQNILNGGYEATQTLEDLKIVVDDYDGDNICGKFESQILRVFQTSALGCFYFCVRLKIAPIKPLSGEAVVAQ